MCCDVPVHAGHFVMAALRWDSAVRVAQAAFRYGYGAQRQAAAGPGLRWQSAAVSPRLLHYGAQLTG